MKTMNLQRMLAVAGLLGASSMFGGYGMKSPRPPKVIDEQKMMAAEAKRRRKAEKRLACK